MMRGAVRKSRGQVARLSGLGAVLGAALFAGACSGAEKPADQDGAVSAPATAAGASEQVDAVTAAATADTAVPAPTEPEPPVFDPAATPCPAEAAVCVDIDGRQSWLQQDGVVTFGPVPVSSGRAGEETPRGTFHTVRKVKDEVSYVFAGEPMPNSVYFTTNGHALHGGDVNEESHGCVHLPEDVAAHYFDTLGIGETVVVY